MKYKAIIFDLDGTAIPNRRDGMPSERLVETLKKLKGKVFVSAATGRSIDMCREVLQKLGLTDPCILSGGTQIVDPVSEKVLWGKLLSKEQIEAISKIAQKYPYRVHFNRETPEDLTQEKNPERMVCISRITPEHIQIMLEDFKNVPEAIAHPVISWTKGCFDVHVTHKEATKRHAVEMVLEMLGVKKEETIGFGDSDNDLPIFEGVGYKVSMENGTDKLKSAADVLAPHVESDGLAEMIEKLIKEGKLNGDNS